MEDPTTARLGEPLYKFIPRSVWGNIVDGWQAEQQRLQSQQLPFSSPENRYSGHFSPYLSRLLQAMLSSYSSDLQLRHFWSVMTCTVAQLLGQKPVSGRCYVAILDKLAYDLAGYSIGLPAPLCCWRLCTLCGEREGLCWALDRP